MGQIDVELGRTSLPGQGIETPSARYVKRVDYWLLAIGYCLYDDRDDDEARWIAIGQLGPVIAFVVRRCATADRRTKGNGR